MHQQLLSLFVIGLAAGGFGALLGVGGGLIIVPALTLLAGLSLHAAIGTSLVCICASSAASAAIYLRRQGEMRSRLVGIEVLRIEDGLIVEIDAFLADIIRAFDLPTTLET